MLLLIFGNMYRLSKNKSTVLEKMKKIAEKFDPQFKPYGIDVIAISYWRENICHHRRSRIKILCYSFNIKK